MRYLTFEEDLELHRRVILQAGGSAALRDLGALESAVAQPRMSFAGEALYPSLEEKATALGYSLIQNHPFMDGNKRVGHAALETLLVLNGYELSADMDDAEQMILGVAAGQVKRDEFLRWVQAHVVPLQDI